MTVTYVIWGITAGMCVAAIYFYFIKKACGGFIKALTENGCVGEENAKNAATTARGRPLAPKST